MPTRSLAPHPGDGPVSPDARGVLATPARRPARAAATRQDSASGTRKLRANITGSRCRRIGARLKWNLFESRQLFHLTRTPNGGDRQLSASIQKSKPSVFASEILNPKPTTLRNPIPSPGRNPTSALANAQTHRRRPLCRDRSPTKAGGEADPAGWVTAVVCLGKQRSAAARLRRRSADGSIARPAAWPSHPPPLASAGQRRLTPRRPTEAPPTK